MDGALQNASGPVLQEVYLSKRCFPSTRLRIREATPARSKQISTFAALTSSQGLLHCALDFYDLNGARITMQARLMRT